MSIGSPIKDDDKENNQGKINKNTSNIKYFEPKSYAFNGKVVIGIGIIMAMAAIITMFMGFLSQSSQINLSVNSLLPSFISSSLVNHSPNSEMATEQQQQSSSSSLPNPSSNNNFKRITLIQQDFGWNGTIGGPPIILNKGDRVQLLVINRGHMAHNFGMASLPQKILDQLNNQTNVPLDQRINNVPYDTMASMPCPDCKAQFEEGHIKLFIEPGTQQVSTFVADKAGQFKYFCMVRGHLWLGMIGDVIVRENPGSTTVKNPTDNV